MRHFVTSNRAATSGVEKLTLKKTAVLGAYPSYYRVPGQVTCL